MEEVIHLDREAIDFLVRLRLLKMHVIIAVKNSVQNNDVVNARELEMITNLLPQAVLENRPRNDFAFLCQIENFCMCVLAYGQHVGYTMPNGQLCQWGGVLHSFFEERNIARQRRFDDV